MAGSPTPKPSTSSPSPDLDLAPWAEPSYLTSPSTPSPYYESTHFALQRYARSYLNTHILPNMLTWESAGAAPRSAALSFVQSGLSFTDIPSAYWPSSPSKSIPHPAGIPPDKLDPFHLLILSDEKSRIEGGVVSSLEGASVIGVPPILEYGTEEQKARWLPGLFSWETSFCLGVTEPRGGSDVASLETTATRSADGKVFVVNGLKKWITGAPWASHMTTAVRTGGPGSGARGISVLVIPLRGTKGVSMRRVKNSGQKAGGASMVELDDVRVPVENLVGRENEGFGVIMRNFNRERFVLAVACNRKARTCLSHAMSYAHERETFGKKLVEHQVIRRKFAEVAHRVEAHWAWLEAIAWEVKGSLENGGRGWMEQSVAGKVALAKVQGGQIVEMACREAQQVFGGKGYEQGEGRGGVVEQISRDLRMLVVGGGSEEIIEDLAVRQEVMMARKRGWKL